MNGTVKRFFDDRGFGFIKPDDGGPEIFFHISAVVESMDRPDAGAAVTFDIGINPSNGKPVARNVRVV